MTVCDLKDAFRSCQVPSSLLQYRVLYTKCATVDAKQSAEAGDLSFGMSSSLHY